MIVKREYLFMAEWELNALVYELYGLTEEEIAVVEGLDHE